MDVITGGSPCQDLSVAGKRAGLAGERSGLFMEQIRLTKELRDADRKRGRSDVLIRPRYFIWENVPGAFSSNGGADFQAVLTETIRIAEPDAPDVPLPEKGKWPMADAYYGDGWSVAYRVLDAQFWGVPQRRRRIALVADFGGWTAGEILLDPQYRREAEMCDTNKAVRHFRGESGSEIQSFRKGLSGDFEQGETAGKEAAGAVGSGTDSAIGFTNRGYDSGNITETLRSDPHGAYPMVARSLTARYDRSPCIDRGPDVVVQGALNGWDAQSKRIFPTDGICATLNSGTNEGMNIVPSVMCANPWDSQSARVYSADGVWHSLNANENGGQSRDSVFCLQGNCIDRADTAGCNGKGWTEDVSYTLNTIDGPAVCAGFSMGQSEKARSIGYQEEISPTLRGGEGGNQKPRVYDARGNGNGETVCTLTGDHQDRVTDYTALCVGNGQLNQISMVEQANTLDTMHDQQAIMCTAVDCRNGTENTEIRKDSCDDTEPRNQILRILQETYGEKAVFQWGIRVLEFLQSEEILRQRMYESSISSKAENGNELGGSTLPSPEIVARWLLRDMREQQECGCSPQGRKSAEQSDGKFAEALPELPSESAQAAKFMLDLWKAGKRLGLLQQALYQIQKVWKSANVQRAVVRRLTPLEAERLQGYPDGWTDIGEWTDSKGKKHKEADSPRYRALGNSIALPPWKWVLKRISAQYERDATLASLFDGIGGFSLLWTQLNGLESVRWVSEIEPFCIAVCKKHFGDSDTGETGDLHKVLFGSI